MPVALSESPRSPSDVSRITAEIRAILADLKAGDTLDLNAGSDEAVATLTGLGAIPVAAATVTDTRSEVTDQAVGQAESDHVISDDHGTDKSEVGAADVPRPQMAFPAWPARPTRSSGETAADAHDEIEATEEDDLFIAVVGENTSESSIHGNDTEDDEAIKEPVTLATEGLDAETKRGLYKHAQQEITSLLDRLNNASYSGKGAKTALYAIFREFELTRQDYLDLIHGVDTRRTVDAIHQVFDESGRNEWVEAAEEAVHTMLGISVYEFAGAGLLVTEDVKLSIRDVAYRLANYMGALLRKQMKQTEQDADEAEDTDAIPEGHRVIAGHDVAQIGTQLRESTQRAWAQAKGWFSGLQLRERLNDLLDSGAAAQDPETVRQIQQAQVRIPSQTARTAAAQPQPAYATSSRYAQPHHPYNPTRRPAPRYGQNAQQRARKQGKDDLNYPDWLK